MKLQNARLQLLKQSVTEISPETAAQRLSQGTVLLDVRENEEVAKGSTLGAIRQSRAFLEFQIETKISDSNTPIAVICASGARSLFVADELSRMGYSNVSSVKGGFSAWAEQGFPVETPPMLSDYDRDRYARHLAIPEVGEEGQQKLLSSRIALVGAGGLGSPLAYYLAAAGVGTLGLIDDDHIERSNLQRQILHNEGRIGQFKVDSAAETLLEFNPNIVVNKHKLRLSKDNIDEIFEDYDLIIDGSDNLPTRYLVNDACVKHQLPLVYGSIFRFEGQISVFWPAGPEEGPCYRCLFPSPPPSELAPSCAEAGVIGVLPGVVGTLMATEALKILLEMGEPLTGKLLTYDALTSSFSTLKIPADPECELCRKAC